MKGVSLLCIVLLGVLGGSVAASVPVGDYFTAEDKTLAINSLVNSQKKDGSFLGLKNTFYAVSSLQSLGSTVPEGSKVCEYTKGALKVQDAESIFYQTSILEALKCSQPMDDKSKATVKAALQSDSMDDLYFGTLVAVLKKTDFEKELQGAVDKILALAEDDGVFHRTEADSAQSTLYSGLALEALGVIAKQVKLSKDAQTKLEDALKNAENIISLAEEDAETVEFVDPDVKGASALRVSAAVFYGLNTLATSIGKPFAGITEDQVVGLARFFVAHKQAATPEDIFFLLQGLNTAAKNQFVVPLVATVVKQSISAPDGLVKIRVSDVLGNFATDAQVTVVKAYQSNQPANAILSNKEAAPVDKKQNSLFQVNFLESKPDAGFYTLVVRVTPKGKGFTTVDSATLSVKVLGSAEVTELVVTVHETTEEVEEGKSVKVGKGKKLSSEVSVGPNQRLNVAFTVKSQGSGKALRVHQAFVRISRGLDEETTVPAKFQDGKYSARIAPSAIASSFYGKGSFNVEVIVGDSFLENSILWPVGTVKIAFPESFAAEKPRSPFAVLPEIVHEFRVPEKRPSKAISSAFTIAVLSPIGILLLGLLGVGANIRNFPTGIDSIYALGFEVCLGAILGLFALYWLELNMMQTLLYLGFLSVPTLFFAHRTLNALAREKVKTS